MLTTLKRVVVYCHVLKGVISFLVEGEAHSSRIGIYLPLLVHHLMEPPVPGTVRWGVWSEHLADGSLMRAWMCPLVHLLGGVQGCQAVV